MTENLIAGLVGLFAIAWTKGWRPSLPKLPEVPPIDHPTALLRAILVIMLVSIAGGVVGTIHARSQLDHEAARREIDRVARELDRMHAEAERSREALEVARCLALEPPDRCLQ